MKTLKQTTVFFLFLLLIMSSTLESCADKSEQTPIPNKSDLQITSDKKLTFPMEKKGEFTVTVTSGQAFKCAVVMKDADKWITTDVTDYPKGTDVPVKFNVTANYSGDDRTAFLLFKNSDMNQYTDTVYLTQSKTLYIDVKEVGNLWKQLQDKGVDSLSIRCLTLKGTLNSADVICLRAMAGCAKNEGETTNGELTDLDMSDVQFKADPTPYFIDADKKQYAINAEDLLPKFIFFNAKFLKTINISKHVNAITQSAFYGCQQLETIHIPDNVTYIGIKTFEGCSLLKNINLSDGINTIGASAFEDCKLLKNIHIPNTIQSLEDNVFNNCISLASIDIPEGVINIGASAFANCSALTDVNIPKTMNTIRKSAFNKCSMLKNVIIKRANPTGMTLEDAIFDKTISATLYVPTTDAIEKYKAIDQFKIAFGNRIVAIK